MGFDGQTRRTLLAAAALSGLGGHALASLPDRARLDTDGGARLHAGLQLLARKDRFSGVVLIAEGSKVTFGRAYGFASREYGARNDLETQFHLASVGKMFTSAAIGHYLQAGRIGLEDSIGDHVDETWLPAKLSRKVTIRHLLTHTSGLGDYFTPENAETGRIGPRLADLKPLIRDAPPVFEPGTRWEYCNTGYALLGAALERLGEDDYDAVIRKLVFEPAGMRRTANLDPDAINPGIAQGYVRRPLRPQPPQPLSGPPPEELGARAKHMLDIQTQLEAGGVALENNHRKLSRGGPAGGGYGTAGDLLKFFNALAGGRLMDARTRALMFAPQPAPASHMGLGFFQHDGGVGHTGGFPGVSNLAVLYPDGRRLIILSNVEMGAYAAVGEMRRPRRI